MTTLLIYITLGFTWADPLPAATAEISVEHAARLYRIEVYNRYRLNRAEYDLRRAIGDEVWAAYEKSSRSDERREDVLCWFEAARYASAEGSFDSLPPLPAFASAEQFVDTEAGEPEETVAVSTSTPEDKFLLEPSGAATQLDIELPKEAVQVGPTRVFSRLIRTALGVWTGDIKPSELGAPSEPGVDEAPSEPAPAEPATQPAPVVPPAPAPALNVPATAN